MVLKYSFKEYGVDPMTSITGDTTVVVYYNKIVDVENSLASELASVDTNNAITLDVSNNEIDVLFKSENTSMLLIFDPIIEVLKSITNNPAYESVVVTYNGKTLVLSDLDYDKLGLVNFWNREEDATKVAQFIAWVAFGSGSGSDVIKVTPKNLIGKTLDVDITLSEGNVSENNSLTEDYDLIFGLMNS